MDTAARSLPHNGIELHMYVGAGHSRALPYMAVFAYLIISSSRILQ